jgi:hypothetical protein
MEVFEKGEIVTVKSRYSSWVGKIVDRISNSNSYRVLKLDGVSNAPQAINEKNISVRNKVKRN